MAVSARQFKGVNNPEVIVRTSDKPPEAVNRIRLCLTELYSGVRFLTDTVDGTTTSTLTLPNYVYRPGRATSGANNFSFSTLSTAGGIIYDNTSSAAGLTSTGTISLVAGLTRVRHGAVGNTASIFDVTDSAATLGGATAYLSVADGGTVSCANNTADALNINRWTGSAFATTGIFTPKSRMTLGNTSVSTTAQLIFDPDGGSSTVLSILNSAARNYITIGTNFLSTLDHVTINNGTASDVLLKLVPHASQSVDTFQIRNAADTDSNVWVTSVGMLRVANLGAVGNVPLQIRRVSSGQTGDLTQWSQENGTTILSRVNNRGHLGIGGGASNGILANLTGTTANLAGIQLTLTDTARTDSATTGALKVITNWDIVSGTTVDMHAFDIQHAANGVGANAFAINGQVTGSGDSGSPGTAIFHALHFAATPSGSVDVLEAAGVDTEATWNGDPGTVISSLIGINARFSAGALGGDTTMAVAGAFTLSFFGGTVTTAYGINIAPAINLSTVGTVYGLNIGDMTAVGASTTWAIHSEGGDSSHAGDFRFGSNSAPTAKVHMDAGSTSAGSAPAKYEAGSLMSAVEAGAREYDGDFHYLTNATSRGAICTAANVVVDGDGNVVTSDGEILLAA